MKRFLISKRKTYFPVFVLMFLVLAEVFLSSVKVCASYPHAVNETGKITINLLVAAIDPTLKSTDDKPYWNGEMEINASQYFGYSLEERLQNWIDVFEEVSHDTVEFHVVSQEIINEFPKYKSIDSLDNESFQAIFKKDAFGYGDWYGGVTSEAFRPYDTGGDLDYNYYVEKLDLVNRKNRSEFDMVYLIGIDPLSPYETCMVGQTPFWVNGEGFTAPCSNFVIVTPTFSRFDGSIENIGHLAEAMLGYTYGSIPYLEGFLDGSNYLSLNDWEKYCLCKFIATPNTEIYGYGMVHFSPNSDSDYDWNNLNPVPYYRDWKNGSDVQDFLPEYMEQEPFAYNGDPCVSHHKWWFYNMPYEQGRDEKGYYKSWWKYILTPDYVTYLSASDETGPEIYLEVGEKKLLSFNVNYYSGLSFPTNTVDSQAVVTVSDPELFVMEDGMLRTMKEGVGNVKISLDGKQMKYIVHAGSVEAQEIVSNNGEESKNALDVQEPENAKSNLSSIRIFAGGVVIILIIVVLALVLKKRK